MEPSTVSSAHFSTGQFDAWRESIAVVFDVEPPVQGGALPFDANVEAFQLADMVVTDARLGEQRYVRSPARSRSDGMDHFVFNLYRTGGWRAQTAQGEFKGRAGQVSVLDLARDLISDEPTSDLVSLFVPRFLVEDSLPNLSGLHGRAPTGPHAALLADYIDLLARRLPTLPSGHEQALSRATCDMLAACLQPSLVGLEAARPGLELVLLRRAKRFINAHLASAELNSDGVCQAVGVSRRTLYRLFEEEGGVQHYIQSSRLARIRLILVDPNDTRRISEIAGAFGFSRSDHFARAFKHQFGLSPSEARGPPHRDGGEPGKAFPFRSFGAQDFENWIRALPV
ncbi:helix-turn-helix domain-containing protein [Chelatococcus reniformis]|uniref:Transcriptional regulator n=1 Tax=Chelatococcus reniformis TaxID=1494448 RepID=A0A916UDE8_9HYPH|nr:helix-turn-helix domain-containing protein [Chelatococcus reniformis]GGC68279.1 transcriptional regulator [Chelatococcus reniformis]